MTPFGTLSDGRPVHRFDLSDGGPLTASILDWGACLMDVRLAGVDHSLTLGTDDLAAYEGPLASAGGLIGPVVNRISGAEATLDGETFRFDAKDEGGGPPRTLHSGGAGTHRKLWQIADHGPSHVVLTHDMPDGEGGFPGNRRTAARYEVEGGALTLTVETVTDAPTWINFANHSYWNLDGSASVEGHVLRVSASRYLPASEEGLVTGEIAPVDGTHLDFREGRALEAGPPHLDHNLCTGDRRGPLAVVGTLTGRSGLRMEIASTEPGLQVFDGWKLDDVGYADHQGRPLGPRRAVALEAQMWPDAPNRPDFPSIRVDPGETCRQVTRWTFHAPD